jgi:tetratricopeptide (TPR) repeat protein
MERKIGQAYLNLGQFDKSEEHFRKALEYMGIPLRDYNSQKGTKFISLKTSLSRSHDKLTLKDSKNASQHNYGELSLDKSETSHRKREAAISLLALSRINYYYACNKQYASYCATLALNITEGMNWLQSEALAVSKVFIRIRLNSF